MPTADGHSSQALAVNDRGDVAGFETTKEGAHRAVLWRVGERVNLHEQLQNSPAMQGQTLVSSKALFVDPLGNVAGEAVSYTHLRAHETREDLVCRLLLEKKKT